MATFKALVDIALQECGYDSSTSSSVPRTRFKRRVNEHYRRILAKPIFSRLLRDNYLYTFASVADQAEYGLPWSLAKLNAITERTSLQRRLEEQSVDWLRTTDPGLTASGTPTVYVPLGWSAVQVQPSNASKLCAISTDASDTGASSIYVEYINASGHLRTASGNITGTTGAEIVTTATAIEVTKVYMPTAAVGTVSLREDTVAGTVLAEIPPGQTSSQYYRIQLWPTPTDALTYNVDYTRRLLDLVNDTDEPMMPPDFHRVLWLAAVADEWALKDDARYGIAKQDADDALKDMTNFVWNMADHRPAPDMGRPRYSRLGGWFPSGT